MPSRWSQVPPPWLAKRTTKGDATVTSPAPPLGGLIHTLRTEHLDDEAKKFADSAKICNVRTVGSYNWLDRAGSGPTILVPGKPPLWTPQTVPSRLNEDSGSYFRDKNAARYPTHPIEPAVVTALTADPTIPKNVDIFACGSSLGNLLRFVRGQDKTFRMLAYKIDKTVFLVRRENSPAELIPNVRGFGHTFPEANTTWEADVRGSASHQRLIRYHFGGLDLVVRFEADGYIGSPGLGDGKQSESPPAATTSPSTTTVENLTASLSTTTVSPTLDLRSPPPNSGSPSPATTLRALPAGTLTPHAQLFELKTRSIYTRDNKDHLAEELPRLWVSQLPTFMLAFHTRGLFARADIEVKDVREEVKRWEEQHADELARLAALLHRVRDMLAAGEEGPEGSDGRVEICHRFTGTGDGSGDGSGVLEVRRQLEGAGEVLSAGVRERWVDAVGAEEPAEKGELSACVEPEAGDDGGDEVGWSEGDGKDFTACCEACGYCGRCTY